MSAEALRVGGDEIRLRLSSAESGGGAFAFEVEMPAGGGPPALHRHPSLEVYRVEEGELVLYLEDQRIPVAAGEVAFIPGGAEHTIRNESDRPARAFVLLSPGGELEAFARAAAALESPEPADVMRLAAENGIEITRPL
jgi:quercetin dioxygenase-like cupin family protein